MLFSPTTDPAIWSGFLVISETSESIVYHFCKSLKAQLLSQLPAIPTPPHVKSDNLLLRDCPIDQPESWLLSDVALPGATW